MPLLLIADLLLCDDQVLGFSNYALSEPVSATERSPHAFTPPYSMTLRYGLASILWLCLGLLQVCRFFLEIKIRKGHIIERELSDLIF